jgi:hypothetical protein
VKQNRVAGTARELGGHLPSGPDGGSE